jgi:hypothetical protein
MPSLQHIGHQQLLTTTIITKILTATFIVFYNTSIISSQKQTMHSTAKGESGNLAYYLKSTSHVHVLALIEAYLSDPSY